MATNTSTLDQMYFSSINSQLNLFNNEEYYTQHHEKFTNILDSLIARLYEIKLKESVVNISDHHQQDLVNISCKLMKIAAARECFKAAKVCQIWEYVMQLPNITLTANDSDHFIEWIKLVLQSTSGSDIILIDVLNCLAAAIQHKEIKLTKGLHHILGKSGILIKKLNGLEVSLVLVSILKVLCNFTHCPGEKDWSNIPKELVETCISQFISILENNLHSDQSNLNLLRAYVLCFHGLENVFVRFQSTASAQLNVIFGLAKCSILFGVAGSSLNYSPILPSSVPYYEAPTKSEQGKTPKLRKKRPPKTAAKKGNTSFNNHNHKDEEEQPGDSVFYVPSKVWKFNAASSSESELSDSEGHSMQRTKENQAKVRACALKMLSAAFKFCDQRTIMGYWSAFLPDSSPGNVFRHSLITPILKDSSVKVRCCALVALSTLMQSIQPTLAMASYQENRSGSFIPFSQTIAETVIAIQRSLLLSLSAEHSTAAFIQLFKCLTAAASVFPYDKLPTELVSKTVHQCSPFLGYKDPDVKVACLSVLRVLLCTHSSHLEIQEAFWDEGSKKCWLLEHCLGLIETHSGFPLTLESLLVVGEVTRCNIMFAQPYMNKIVTCICIKLISDSDSGIQIRCAKALGLVCSSILQEMEKEDSLQKITREEAVQLWIYILRHGITEILQKGTCTPLKAEACATLATVGSQIFECLPRDLRILFATLALGCAADPDPGVRAAAIRTIGFAVTFNTLNDDASFLMDSSETILLLLKDSNLLVALNASWALGNLADTLDKDKNSLLEELPQRFLIGLIQAAFNAIQGPMKVRCNGIRALGIFLKIMSDIPDEGGDTAVLLDQAISSIVKHATTGNFMKNRWNACYAVGNVFQNVALMSAFSHWMEKLLDGLMTVFRSCSNFKVRISAANAMLHLNDRQLLSSAYVKIWLTLLESLAASEQIEDFSEFQHHETMCLQICKTLCKLITLMTKEDLSLLQDILMKHYDICSVQFGKFLKSLLPDQLELVLEATDYVQHFGSGESLSSSQKSTLGMLKELLTNAN